MPPHSPQDESSIRPPHPLAQRLIERLRERPGSRVLDFCTGSGRNAAALSRAGHAVAALNDDHPAAWPDAPAPGRDRFAAVICTHGLLHGTTETIAGRLSALAGLLGADGLFYAVFGSVRDARFGKGTPIDRNTFAPVDGDERGIAHTYFSRAPLRALLETDFVIELLEEYDADGVAGSWAHAKQPLLGAVHWFVIAKRRAPGALRWG
ncbi:MAG: hypothetical protein ABI231_07600 [Candidatus Tumulicola sp.]